MWRHVCLTINEIERLWVVQISQFFQFHMVLQFDFIPFYTDLIWDDKTEPKILKSKTASSSKQLENAFLLTSNLNPVAVILQMTVTCSCKPTGKIKHGCDKSLLLMTVTSTSRRSFVLQPRSSWVLFTKNPSDPLKQRSRQINRRVDGWASFCRRLGLLSLCWETGL